MAKFHLVYPEKRIVSEKQISTWFHDAVANEEIADEFIEATSISTMADALEDAGIITIADIT